MILKNSKRYYPLSIGKIIKNGKVFYDRSERKASFFYLELTAGNLADARGRARNQNT